MIDGKKKIKTIGSRVIPRSSPLFQEFKIWQVLNNIEVYGKGRKIRKRQEPSSLNTSEDPLQNLGKRRLYQEEKELLAAELSIKKELKKADALKLLFDNPKELDMNFNSIQGNSTQAALFDSYKQIIELSGHEIDYEKKSANEILKAVEEIFSGLGFNTKFLHFTLAKTSMKAHIQAMAFAILFEGDSSKTGNENLISKIKELYGFDRESAKILANVTFQDDYGSLSARAIYKILHA
jgi:CRISPR-associated endonuclease Csn1